MILIITNPTDHAVTEVTAFLTKKGEEFVRIHLNELLQQSTTLALAYNNKAAAEIVYNGVTIKLTEVKSIWYRQAYWNDLNKEISSVEKFVQQEWRYSFWSMFTALPGYWVNHPFWANNLLEHNKFYQLKLAVNVGLKVPDTIISNSFEQISSFCNQHNGIIACKPVHNQMHLNEENEVLGMYTQLIKADELPMYKSNLQLSPVIVQEYVEKLIELRVTIVGKHVFACEIHSQNSGRSKHDWRKYDFANVEHKPHRLPDEIENKLLELMTIARINFGAIDLILKPDGTYVFLEINPSGQYGWIEYLTNMPISETFAEALIAPSENGIRYVDIQPVKGFWA